MPKKLINEIFLMRSISCLSILLLHSLARAYADENNTVNLVRVLLTFGTPAFIFISEFILSRSYPQELPSNFWSKRLKFIMVPYVLFGTFYAFLKAFEQSISSGSDLMGSFINFLWRHLLLGDYHGYFILVIFQFYLLHYFFDKFLKKWNPASVMGSALLINLIYLGFFNFVKPYPSEIGAYIWDKFYWIPFFGWLFYFTLAYYCGRNFSSFINFLNKYSKWVIVSPLLCGGMCLFLYDSHLISSISSKRVDMVFFTTSMILLIYYIATKLPKVPKIFVWISQYSFGIYLIHPVFLALMYVFFNRLSLDMNPLFQTIFYFIGSLLLSIVVTFVLNKIPYGYYFVGKIGIGLNSKKSRNLKDSDLKTVHGRSKYI
ncbi:hypothetical protein E2K98_10275 [Bacillus salipaludis]|uniref:Acyltransferase family protein n=1 Tax=Bacillus salipaludis TaxID=2547811 RepID=A0A4R5VW30_9BACI|nr:acyltransferase family protein [Bacillus salipaludis]MDQ6600110.1 acyltransferase family protein [Bacillus salipaludis]TDK62424.1 hypothetical protein E2K98_10275 [Bacillus salipaludis]